MGRLSASLQWVQRNLQTIVIVSSISLALFGVLLIFNQLIRVTTLLQDLLRAIGLDFLVELG